MLSKAIWYCQQEYNKKLHVLSKLVPCRIFHQSLSAKAMLDNNPFRKKENMRNKKTIFLMI